VQSNLEVDIGVEDLRLECYNWWSKRILHPETNTLQVHSLMRHADNVIKFYMAQLGRVLAVRLTVSGI
jgi:hypothetical protein